MIAYCVVCFIAVKMENQKLHMWHLKIPKHLKLHYCYR